MKKNFIYLLALTIGAMTVISSCTKDDDDDDDDTNTEVGIIGTWEAYDVSPLLLSLGYDDSLKVDFKDDNTYEVTSYIQGIAYVLVGTYVQEASMSGNIWDITLNQISMNGAPTDITSQGIFEVYTATPDSMWYEVAQTNPEISGVTPPTPAAGFGSTSGGAFAMTNIQKYIRK
jgi:hypothetical protein